MRLMWRSLRHSRQKFSLRKEHQRRQNSLQRSPVFEQLQGVSHLTRTTYLLLALQLNQLELACTSFGEAFRLSYPNQTLTVKGYMVEQHVAAFAQKYEICITFGEDGLESLHPWDARCRLIPRTMRVTQRLGTKPPCRTLASRFGRMCLPLACPNGQAQRLSLRLRLPLKLRLLLRPHGLLWGRAPVFPSMF